MSEKNKLIVGSRGSDLAVTQTKWVISEIKKKNPDLEVELKIIKTTGDADQKTDLDKFKGMGVFVKELEIALLEKEIDCAVHSLKDVPEDTPEELSLVCFPPREDTRDVFISNGTPFSEIKPGSVIGSGSPRRIVQLRKLRDDLTYIPIRGNLDTRIRKVKEGEVAGTLLAMAGIKRLSLKDEVDPLPFTFEEMIPAVGQGALAIECRSLDVQSITTVKTINDDLTEAAVLLERAFMKAVGGGCKVPMACHVFPLDEGFRMLAMMGDIKTGKTLRKEQYSSFDDLDSLVENLTENLLDECREEKIPIPKDLPEHYLLNPGE